MEGAPNWYLFRSVDTEICQAYCSCAWTEYTWWTGFLFQIQLSSFPPVKHSNVGTCAEIHCVHAWLVCDWCVTGVWLVRDWCVTGAWLVCDWCVTGAWLVRLWLDVPVSLFAIPQCMYVDWPWLYEQNSQMIGIQAWWFTAGQPVLSLAF